MEAKLEAPVARPGTVARRRVVSQLLEAQGYGVVVAPVIDE